MSERVKLRIDRERWLRGEGEAELRDAEGHMCCLGFACIAAGVPAQRIEGHGEPFDVFHAVGVDVPDVPDVWRWLWRLKATSSFIKVNDDEAITEYEREQELTTRFHARGIDVEFYGGEA